MRIIISALAASMLVAAGAATVTEAPPAEPVRTEAQTVAPSQDDSAEGVRPVVQASVAKKPRESGLDQPLCTGEDH